MSRATDLIEAIREEHEWDEGQVMGGSGAGISSTDRCPICGLVYRRYRDPSGQTPDSDDFCDEQGNRLTLAAAKARGCQ